MIGLLKNHIPESAQSSQHIEHETFQADEAQLIHLIYRFAGKKDEWFNLLLSLSNCISINESLPEGHPYHGVSERLLSHLKNAIKISGRLNAGAYTLLNNNSLDQLPIPAGIMDFTGRIIEINQRAQNIIQELPQWSIQAQQLKLQHLDIQSEIHKLAHSQDRFCSLPLYYDDALDKVINHQASQENRFYLTQIPNPENPSEPYIYFCFNEKKSSLINPEALKAEYHLTETETLVVVTLLEEITSRRIAKKLKLKEATIRGHLTNIYLKFDVSRKPELIRKIMLQCLSQATKNKQFFSQIDSRQTPSDYPMQSNPLEAKCQTLKTISLKDDRDLSYLDLSYCDHSEATDVVVILHNIMGSAFELPSSVDALLKARKIRILVPERPGYGDSSVSENRTHEEFCHDLTQLLDQLEIDTVKLVAHSIGGTYALAMAEFIPERIERIAMVNAVTRIEDMLLSKPVPVLLKAVRQSLRYAPFLIEPVLKMTVGKDLEHFYTQQLNFIRPTKEGRAADINLLSQPEFRRYCLKNLKQSAKQGIQIWSDELKLSFSELPFKVQNKTMEYQFWHGDEDDVVSVHAAIRLAKDLNTQSFFRLKYETHYLFSRHIDEVLYELVSPSQSMASEHFQAVSID